MTFADLIVDVIAHLDRAAIPYMITGSVASTFHGEPRATRNVDIVIDPGPDSLIRLVTQLRDGGYYVDRDAAEDALGSRAQFNAIGGDTTKVDFIIRKDRPFSIAEFARRERVELFESTGYMATAEDVILAKLEWAAATDSERQLRDVAGMLAVGGDALDAAYLTRWADQLGLRDALDRLVGSI